ncbi:MAG: hypothetical protein ACE5L6_09240 [Candidatus Bathyarchaeia archaeon]
MTLECETAKPNFKKSLLRAVEEGLLTLGESPRKVIYYYLKTKFQLKREDIPEKAEQFDKALNSIFGPGAEVIERYIVKDLYQRLKLNLEEKKDFKFVDYVREAQLSLRRGEDSDLQNIERQEHRGRQRD